MPVRILSPEASLRLFNLVNDDAPLPPKIAEHRERIEVMMATVDRRLRLQDTVNNDELCCLMDTRLALDTLYGDWAEGNKRIRWVDIPQQADVTPDDVMRECTMSTESYFGNMGVEVLAAYLDACGCDRLLFRLAEACILRVREYLNEVRPLSKEDIAILDDPAQHFKTTDQEVLHGKLIDHFHGAVNQQSAKHIKQAMVANIEWGTENPVAAITAAEFAYCEAEVEQFGLKLHTGHPEVLDAFESFEQWKAQCLIELLK